MSFTQNVGTTLIIISLVTANQKCGDSLYGLKAICSHDGKAISNPTDSPSRRPNLFQPPAKPSPTQARLRLNRNPPRKRRRQAPPSVKQTGQRSSSTRHSPCPRRRHPITLLLNHYGKKISCV